MHHAESAKETTAYEIGLLKLASNFLRKRIILVPLLETDSVQTIEPSDPRICTGQYIILLIAINLGLTTSSSVCFQKNEALNESK